MKVRNDVRLILILVIGDLVAVNMAFLAAYWLRFNSGVFPVVYGIPGVHQYIRVLPVISIILLFLMRFEKLYSVKSRISIVDEFFLIVRAGTLGMFIFTAATFAYREYSFSRGAIVIAWVIMLVFLSVWRFFVNRLMFFFRRRLGKTRDLILIGDGEMVERLIKHISDDPHWDYRIKGVLRIKIKPSGKVLGVPVLGSMADLKKVADKEAIEEVILTELEAPRKEVMDLMLECEKKMIEFRLIADLLGMMTSQVDMRTIDGIPLLGLKESPLGESYNRLTKRCVDIVFSVFGLLILSPVFLVIALAVKMNSPGPVFYFQKRIGEDGRRFAIIKFRTMKDNAEKGVGRVWASQNDPRRTAVGAFLRRFNLDELPQLFNVLGGEMSLVGPRPERPHFVGKFKENIPRYMSRHKIKSGMTGWAQVNGLRGNTSIEERTKYDLYYIENWSLMFDLKIIFMSFFALKNAY